MTLRVCHWQQTNLGGVGSRPAGKLAMWGRASPTWIRCLPAGQISAVWEPITNSSRHQRMSELSEAPLLHRVQLRRRFCHFGAVVILSDMNLLVTGVGLVLILQIDQPKILGQR